MLRNRDTYYVINKPYCFVDIRFEECGISPLTVKALTDAGYVQTTVVQETALPMCLEGTFFFYFHSNMCY
jgi:superfamily II DNA/RNA helicase